MRTAWMSIGKGSGENRAVDAAQAALASRYWMYPFPEPKRYCLMLPAATTYRYSK